MTSRGFKEEDMKQIAVFIDRVISQCGDSSIAEKVKGDVKEYCSKFPLYPGL